MGKNMKLPGKSRPVKSDFRNSALECLGSGWPVEADLFPEVIEVTDRGDHIAELVSYQVEPGERVKAWLLRPVDGAASGNDSSVRLRPGIAVWHQHNDEYHLGKGESAGFTGNPMHHTGLLLVREGYVVLCPDALGFEDRQDTVLKGVAYERHMAMRYISGGKCLAWKNILDCRRAVDYLCSRREVDNSRIGCYGHSLGSTFTWLAGPWDERLICMVGNCCMPSQAAMDAAGLNHSFSNYIPGLGCYGDIPDYVALCAPRRLHLNFGAGDPLNPISFVKSELPSIAAAYRDAGAAGSFTWLIDEKAGHELSESMKDHVLQVFRHSL
jgi:hypothetical protein